MEKKIIIYSTPTCMYCNMLKAYLDDQNVKYQNIDISTDPEKQKYLAEKTGQLGVPVTEIDEEFIIGFDQVAINEKLGL